MKIIKIIDKVFKREFLLIYNCSIKEANKYLKKCGNKYLIKEDNLVCAELLKGKYDTYQIMYLEKLSKKTEDLAILTHELFHYIIRLCADRGIPNIPNVQTGECGDETGAYLMEYYFNEIIKKI